MALATFTEAAKALGYKSRSQLYKLKNKGLLDDYLVDIGGVNYLELQPRNKTSLGDHIMSNIQIRPSNPIREFDLFNT